MFCFGQLSASYEQPQPYDLPVTVRGMVGVEVGELCIALDSRRLWISNKQSKLFDLPTTARWWGGWCRSRQLTFSCEQQLTPYDLPVTGRGMSWCE